MHLRYADSSLLSGTRCGKNAHIYDAGNHDKIWTELWTEIVSARWRLSFYSSFHRIPLHIFVNVEQQNPVSTYLHLNCICTFLEPSLSSVEQWKSESHINKVNNSTWQSCWQREHKLFCNCSFIYQNIMESFLIKQQYNPIRFNFYNTKIHFHALVLLF